MVENSINKINMDEICESYKKIKIEIIDRKNDDHNQEKWEHYNPLLNNLEETIAKTDNNCPEHLKLLTMFVAIYYEQARIYISENDLKSSLDNLVKSLELIRNYKNHPNVIYLYFRIVNLYSYLQTKNGSLEEAKCVLLDAEKLYYNIDNKENITVYSTDDLFKNSDEGMTFHSTKFEKLVTNNLQMLGWIYNKKNLQDTFVIYHHTVLKRQFEYQDGNALAWVLKCARLSSYFLSKQRFHEARHHLAASLAVLQEYEKELQDYHNDSNFLEEWEELQHYYADVARYWVKYGLFLFNASKFCKIYPDNDSTEALNKKNYDKGDHENITQIDKNDNEIPTEHADVDKKDNPTKPLLFSILNVDHIEKQVTDQYITTTEQARSLFIHSHMWLKRAKQFYTVHEHTIDYVNAILDLSELYRYLACYEVNIDSQYNVQKRRAEVLETLSNILKDFRPQCYVAVSIDLFRELAEVQMELLALNMQKLYHTEPNSVFTQMNMLQNFNERKMVALSDIYTRLDTFHDRFKFNKQ